MSTNPATREVTESREASPVHAYVADRGSGVMSDELRHVPIAGKETAISVSVTETERQIIEESIRSIGPTANECFANALRLWELNPRFKYVEGFAVKDDLEVGEIEHAWCSLDGEKLVDPTTAFDHYHGVTIEDRDVLQQYVDESPEHGILGNHTDRFAFLREKGYVGDVTTPK